MITPEQLMSAEFNSHRDETIFDLAIIRAPIIDLVTEPKLANKLLLPKGVAIKNSE